MILSVSRRTDIPAFYSDWFFNRVKEGFLLVRNPMNIHQLSKVNILPDVVDCMVFWTKNPKPMLERLNELNSYNYYFQFTLNSYDKNIEINVPEKKDIIKTFQKLSNMIGRNRVVWRYDPIFLTNEFNIDYHIKWFDYLAEKLSGYTNKCVISFIDLYKKTQKNLSGINLIEMNEDLIAAISYEISNIASKYSMPVETCSEKIDLSKYNIKHGKCIDEQLIARITGKRIESAKDPNQRLICGCIKSIDIGAYNTCKHNCLYCYANFNKEMVYKNVSLHNDSSPLLCGEVNENDNITLRVVSSDFRNQLSFLEE